MMNDNASKMNISNLRYIPLDFVACFIAHLHRSKSKSYVCEKEVKSSLAQQNCGINIFHSVFLAVITDETLVMKINHIFHLLIVSPVEECHLNWEI